MGDLHLRASTPRSRKDDYARTLLGKLDQIQQIATDRRCKYILQPGDFFDGIGVPHWLIREAILGRNRSSAAWLVVLGQHDQRYHTNSFVNTPLGIMEAARAVKILTPELNPIPGPVAFYGASWGQDIPIPDESGCPKVLLLHRMVLHNEKLWWEQQQFSWSRILLRRNPFDLIVTGDNHHFFTDKVPGPRYLVNCGSLMRTNIDQADHQPSVVLYDTDDKTMEIIPLKVEPSASVLQLEGVEERKQHDNDLTAFIEQVRDNQHTPDLNFLDVVRRMSRAKDVEHGTKEKVNQIVEMSNAADYH